MKGGGVHIMKRKFKGRGWKLIQVTAFLLFILKKKFNEWLDYFLIHQNCTLIIWSKLFALEGES